MPDRNNYNRNRNDDEFSFEIIENIGVMSTSQTGWSKELNRVSWNGREAKLDIREWHPDHGRMRKGVSFTDEEALELRELLDLALASYTSPVQDGLFS